MNTARQWVPESGSRCRERAWATEPNRRFGQSSYVLF